ISPAPGALESVTSRPRGRHVPGQVPGLVTHCVVAAYHRGSWRAARGLPVLEPRDDPPMNPNRELRHTIVRLLSNMASAKEIQQYLKRFSQLDATRFAVVEASGAVLRDDLDSLVSSLAFLQQVGLTPIVVHGVGPQLDDELAASRVVCRV